MSVPRLPRRALALAVLALLASLLPAAAAHAGLPVYVVDRDGARVLEVDSATGAARTLASGAPLTEPTGIALEAGGDLVVSDAGLPGVVRVDRRTGTQEIVVDNVSKPMAPQVFATPQGIAVATGGRIVVTDSGSGSGQVAGGELETYTAALLRVDLGAGETIIRSRDGFFADPAGVAVRSDGRFVVADPAASGGGVIVVAASDGAQAVGVAAGHLAEPSGVAVESGDTLLVTDAQGAGAGKVFRVVSKDDPPAQLASGGALVDPRGIDLEQSGSALVADPGAGSLIRVSATGGGQTVVATGLGAPADVAVPADDDGDGVPQVDDLCPGVADPANTDTDGDGIGDACDPDDDGDGIDDALDNCPLDPNADQADEDGDGIGDACAPPPVGSSPPPSGGPSRDEGRKPGAHGTTAFEPRVTTPRLAATGTPAVEPVLGKTVGATRRTGRVTVRLPGSSADVALEDGEIPVGAIVDTTRGSIVLTSALPDGRVQSARFSGGRFRVTQQRSGTTDLRIVGSLACASAELRKGLRFGRVTAVASASKAKKKQRKTTRTSRSGSRRPRLWGDGHGRFRTHGRNAVATVRGTKWLVEETCQGTRIRVARGVVAVRDKRAKRTRLLRKGQTYLARYRRAR
jgi:hypothetical protein